MKKTKLMTFGVLLLLSMFILNVYAETETLIDSYITNYSYLTINTSAEYGTISRRSHLFQSFAVSDNSTITRLAFRLAWYGFHTVADQNESLVVGVRAAIYSSTGVFGVNSLPFQLIAKSATWFNEYSLTTGFQEYSFYFNPPVELTPGHYCAVIYAENGFATSVRYILVSDNALNPTHPGNAGYYKDGAWNVQLSCDLCFKVYGYPTQWGEGGGGGGDDGENGGGFDLLAWIKANWLLVLILAAAAFIIIYFASH